MADKLSRLHIIVTGRVQNVGFRAFVQDTAYRLQLSGWVRNISFNQVESLAEGTRSVLEQFCSIIKQGSRGSRVDDSREEWGDGTGEFSDFRIVSSH